MGDPAGDRPLEQTVRPPPHIGGMKPFLPALMRVAEYDPSAALVAPTSTPAPGTISDLSPGSKVTIGASGGTTTFTVPPLKVSVSSRPAGFAATSATVALVIMLCG